MPSGHFLWKCAYFSLKIKALLTNCFLNNEISYLSIHIGWFLVFILIKYGWIYRHFNTSVYWLLNLFNRRFLFYVCIYHHINYQSLLQKYYTHPTIITWINRSTWFQFCDPRVLIQVTYFIIRSAEIMFNHSESRLNL